MPAALPIAIAGSAAVGAGASIYSANKQADATRSAAQTQLEGANISANALEANGAASRAFLSSQADKARADVAPFLSTGLSALRQQYDIASDPNSAASQRQFQVGSNQIASSLAARGLLRSGAFGQNLSDLRMNIDANRFNQLSSISDAGKGAANALSGIDTNLGNNVAAGYNTLGQSLSQLYTGSAQSQAQLGIAGAQLGAQGFVGASNALQSGVGNYLNYNLLSSLLPKQGIQQLGNGTATSALGNFSTSIG